MSVLQQNIWTCDLCGKIETQSNPEACAWDDPVIRPPDGWSSEFHVPDKYQIHPAWDICDACQDCQVSPNWTNYRGPREPSSV